MNLADCIDLINRLLPEPHASLLQGLLFGTRTTLPPSLTEALVDTGTLHIAALSGMNIGILASLMDRIFTPSFGKRTSLCCILGIIIWFVWFVGPTPSLVRAGIMGGLSVLATLLGRQYWAVLSWGLTIVLMLVVRPEWGVDLSFQLSAFATLGIILFGGSQKEPLPKFQEKDPISDGDRVVEKPNVPLLLWQSLPTVVRDTLHVTLSAQVFTIPIILWSFRRISLISPLANLAIGWIIAPLTALGWITIGAGFVYYPLGYCIALIDWVFLEYLVRTVQALQNIPFSSVSF